MTGDSDCLRVEVVFAQPTQQTCLHLRVVKGSTVADAIAASGLLTLHPDIDLNGCNLLGIFGRLVQPETLLRDGDRVEIYRPLPSDPKLARQKRVRAGRRLSGGQGGWKNR